MEPPAYTQLPSSHCFDHQALLHVLRGYRAPGDKVSLMLQRGEIVRVRKGLYVRAPDYGGTTEPVELAGAIYGPSYVSLEYVLSRHGLIPEGVVAVTCVTTKRTRTFHSPVGTYIYEHIPARAFGPGVLLETDGAVGVMMATPEKALCDRLARTPGIRTGRELEEHLLENMRVDDAELPQLSLELLREIEEAYHMQRISLFVRWFVKTFGTGG